jgi:hypothetical protein
MGRRGKHIPACVLSPLAIVVLIAVLVGLVRLFVAAFFVVFVAYALAGLVVNRGPVFDCFLGGFLVAFVAYALAGLLGSLRTGFVRLLGGFFTAFVAYALAGLLGSLSPVFGSFPGARKPFGWGGSYVGT